MSENTPWILLRGLMRDQRHWGHFPTALQAAWPEAPLHCVDLPGNGSRHHEASPASVPAMAEWLRSTLRAQGIAPPYRVFAMSLGAMVTVAWAQAQPQEIDAAVLVNTSLKPISPFYQRLQPAAWPLLGRMATGRASAADAEAGILQLTSRHHAGNTALLQQWIQWHQQQPVSRANALRQLLAAARFTAPRTAPRPRLLLLNGAGDQLVSPRCSTVLAQHWHCPLAVHPTAGHDLPLDAPDWVIAQVRQWLGRAD